MAARSRKKRGPNRCNSVQLCLFDVQIAIEAVDALTLEFARALNERPTPALYAAYNRLRVQRASLREHNARLATLLAA